MDSLSILATAAASAPRSHVPRSKLDFTVRTARKEDIPLLGPVEQSAAQLFRTVNLGHLASGRVISQSRLLEMADSNHIWVAIDKLGQPIGFAAGENIDGNFHIVEISVAQEYQRNGVGKALMSEMIGQAKGENFKAITLTTYRNLPWNERWYSKMGFSEAEIEDMGTELSTLWSIENQQGHDMDLRCIMKRSL